MNAAILQRLMWKEYRFLRSFWLATLLLALCAAGGWCGLATWYQQTVNVEDFFLLAAVVTSMFALGAGGTMFATEHELGTSEFLCRLPLDARHLLCGKLLLSVGSVLALKFVLWNAACLSAIWFWWRGDSLSTIWWCSLVSEMELFAWGLLFSVLTRQPLLAITWAVTVASAIVHMVLPFLWPMTRYDAQYVRGGITERLRLRTA